MSTKKVGPEVGAFVPIEVPFVPDQTFLPIEVSFTEATPVVEITEPTTGKKEN